MELRVSQTFGLMAKPTTTFYKVNKPNFLVWCVCICHFLEVVPIPSIHNFKNRDHRKVSFVAENMFQFLFIILLISEYTRRKPFLLCNSK